MNLPDEGAVKRKPPIGIHAFRRLRASIHLLGMAFIQEQRDIAAFEVERAA